MPGLISECELYFHTSNLYDVLDIPKESSSAELRKAFYKMSLLHHPDRKSEDIKEEATKRFQTLAKVYSILSDTEKRKVYDETNVIDEDDTISSRSYDDWLNYWQLIFPRVTTRQIDEYAAKYKGSPQELTDLASIYERCKGDMDVIIESLMFCSYSDETRIRSMIQQLIDEKRVRTYKSFTEEPPTKKIKRAKLAKKEERMFEKEMKKQSSQQAIQNNDDSLVSAILASRERHLQSSENLIARLTEKYGNPSKTKKRKTVNKNK